MHKSDFLKIKTALQNIINDIYDDNLETAKEITIFHLASIECKALNERVQDIQQATNSEQLKKKLGSIVALCDLIVKTRYTLC